MVANKPAWRVIDGNDSVPVHAERIAMSLVVRDCKRLDIPVSAVVRVEANAMETFFDGHVPIACDRHHIRIFLTPNARASLRDFTRDLVDEVMDIWIGNRRIVRLVVREPLGAEPSFHISAGDFAEAQSLADQLRTGWRPMRMVD
jgi:hypothetical protein